MNFTPNDDSSCGCQACEKNPQKQLSYTQTVMASCALLELNVAEKDLKQMAEKASLPYSESLRLQWMGFVHAGIIYSLMDKAPQEVVVQYVGQTKPLLKRLADMDDVRADAFIDSILNPYVELLMSHEQRKTPFRLLNSCMGEGFAEAMEAPKLAFISGMMAITLCNILDTLGRYQIVPDEAISDEI